MDRSKQKSAQIRTLPFETRILHPQMLHFAQIDSTNSYLLRQHVHPPGTVVMADYQTHGKGRLGRSWLSKESESLLFSIYLTENLHHYPLYAFTFLAAVAVHDGLLHCIPDSALEVKWPNDVLLNGKKVCGILVQSRMLSANETRVVIGIGININQPASFFQNDLRFGTSLFAYRGEPLERRAVLDPVLQAIDRQLLVLREQGAAPILEKWKRCCRSLGKSVAVDDGQQIQRGIFLGLAPDVGLILQTANGKNIFYAADVSLVKEEPECS